MVGTGTSA